MPTTSISAGNSFLEPQRIVAGFGLQRGDHAADFGAGHGFFTLAMAIAVGRDGKVWAVDIQKEALDMVRSRAMAEHLLNIEYLRADLEQPGTSGLPERFMDFVLIGNMLFQAQERGEVLREAWVCLRSKGRLAMIEWDAMASPVIGPPAAQRIKKQDAKSLAIGAGFEPDREFSAGPHHYGLLFMKP
ncbi:MAG: methyltransferase domain-containing protein [Patescibacteria group bacterium]